MILPRLLSFWRDMREWDLNYMFMEVENCAIKNDAVMSDFWLTETWHSQCHCWSSASSVNAGISVSWHLPSQLVHVEQSERDYMTDCLEQLLTNAIRIDWTEIKSLKLIILPFFLLQLQPNRAKQVLREYILFMISF